jgi:hypothetical protein
MEIEDQCRFGWLKSKRTEINVNSSAFSKVTDAETSKSLETAITFSIGKTNLSIPNSTDVVCLTTSIGQFA